MNNILPPERLVLASCESLLALWQAKHIQKRLQGIDSYYETSILGLTMLGNQIFDKRLSKIGSKGLFITELEATFSGDHTDSAFHSPEDAPIEMPKSFALSTVLEIKEFH
jgi:hydroxymethylbilane synthase